MTVSVTLSLEDAAFIQHGQCRFGLFDAPVPMLSPHSTTVLKLWPYNGNKIIVGGALRTIPASGVLFTNDGLAASTTYYAYVSWDGAQLVGEFATTGHATDPDTGVEVKAGDPSRTLVGFVRTWTDGKFRDWQNYCCIRSWFNDPGIRGEESIQDYRTISASQPGQFSEIHPELRIYCLLWANEYPTVGATGMVTMSQTGSVWTSIVWDTHTGDSLAAVQAATIPSSGYLAPIGMSQTLNSRSDPMAEGFHFFTLTGRCNIGTATWIAHQQAGTPTSLCLHSRKT